VWRSHALALGGSKCEFGNGRAWRATLHTHCLESGWVGGGGWVGDNRCSLSHCRRVVSPRSVLRSPISAPPSPQCTSQCTSARTHFAFSAPLLVPPCQHLHKYVLILSSALRPSPTVGSLIQTFVAHHVATHWPPIRHLGVHLDAVLCHQRDVICK
jgi:hypothetical protein